MKKEITKKGFTLIELLVVIAIVATLSGIVMQSLMYARQKARDTTRKAQLIELQKAVSRYFTETGAYPVTPPNTWYSSEIGDPAGTYQTDWIPEIVGAKMISSLPKDPTGGISTCAGDQKRAYLYRSDGLHYKIISNCAFEQESYPSPASQFYDPKRPDWAIQVTDSIAATGTGCPFATTCW